jgi:hypothetical protein
VTFVSALLALLASQPASSGGPEVYALTDVRIVVAPGQEIENGTIVLRDGVIVAVGADVTAPADARILERTDLTAYPGLIDAYVESSWPVQPDGDLEEGSHPNPLVRPERAMAAHGLPEAAAGKLREAGFTTAAVSPKEGIFRGSSAVLNLGQGGVSANLLEARHAQNVTFASTSRGGGYPTSLMGSVALFRQTLLDTLWQQQAWSAYESDPAQARPPLDRAYSELLEVARGKELVVLEGDSALDTLRNGALVQEFGLRAQLVGSGNEYRWLDEVSALGLPLIVPVNFPELPRVTETDDLSTSLEDLRSWDQAPGNLRSLLDRGNTIAVTSHRLDEPGKVLENLHAAIERGGLDETQALAALTTEPARLLGIDNRAGTLEVGKMANLVLVAGDLFADKPEIREVWIDGNRFEIKTSEPATIEPAGTWDLTVTTEDGQTLAATLTLEGMVASLSGSISEPSGGVVALSAASVSGDRLEVEFEGTSYGLPGPIEFFLDIEGDSGAGSGTTSAGSFTIKATRSSGPTEATR